MRIFMSSKLISLLAIGGSDPLGGAGIQADILAGNSLGLHVMTAITAVTSQNSNGIRKLNIVPPEILLSQLDAIFEDVIPDAIKIGMIGNIENAKIIFGVLLEKATEIPIIIDPVMSASAGGNLYQNNDDLLTEFYQTKLFPIADVVSPNNSEATKFLKFNKLEISENKKENAIKLLDLWKCDSVVLKGGHDDSDFVNDILADRMEYGVIISESSHPKINCKNLHGTGCVYAALMASYLALGFQVHEAFIKTSEKINSIIKRSDNYHLGISKYGPLNITAYRL